MSSTHLPSPRQVITDLVHQINSLALPPPQPDPDPDPDPDPATSNPLKHLPQSTRQLFVTLHCLLPSSFLPALDLLDKRLVTRYTPDALPGGGMEGCRKKCVYYVAPTQVLSRSRFSAGPLPASYEVRTDAWSCSCAGFSFASYGPRAEEEEVEVEVEVEGVEREVEAGAWGGLMLGSGSPPVCKHLVACYLAQQCWQLFGGYVKDERVSVERLAEMAEM